MITIVQVAIKQILDRVAVMTKMVQLRASILDASLLRLALMVFEKIWGDTMSNSYFINLSFMKLCSSVIGVFDPINDPFHESHPKKRINIAARSVLKNILHATHVEKQQAYLPISILSNFLDRYAKSADTKLSPIPSVYSLEVRKIYGRKHELYIGSFAKSLVAEVHHRRCPPFLVCSIVLGTIWC